MKKRINVTYVNEMVEMPRGTEFVCVGGGDLFGKIAKVNPNSFMQLIWVENGEDVESDPLSKHYPFVERIS